MGHTELYNYTCSLCERECTSGWTQEEALEEFRKNFGREKNETDKEICDDCYKMMVADLDPIAWAKDRRAKGLPI